MHMVQHTDADLGDLLDKVERGETVVITRSGLPVARLVLEKTEPRRSREEVISAIRTFRKKMPRLAPGEIKSSIEEGRRY